MFDLLVCSEYLKGNTSKVQAVELFCCVLGVSWSAEKFFIFPDAVMISLYSGLLGHIFTPIHFSMFSMMFSETI